MNGRIEITLGGKIRTLRFNNYAREQMGRIFQGDPLEAVKMILDKLKDYPTKAMVDLVYAGLVGAYEARETPIDFVRADVAEWVGDADNAELGKVFDTWVDSSKLREIIPHVENLEKQESDKKKRPGKISKTSR